MLDAAIAAIDAINANDPKSIPDDSGRFFLDLRLLPPRWVPIESGRR